MPLHFAARNVARPPNAGRRELPPDTMELQSRVERHRARSQHGYGEYWIKNINSVNIQAGYGQHLVGAVIEPYDIVAEYPA